MATTNDVPEGSPDRDRAFEALVAVLVAEDDRTISLALRRKESLALSRLLRRAFDAGAAAVEMAP